MTGTPLAEPHSTRDPRRAGMKAAILTRLRDRLKVAAEFSEPGYAGWKHEIVRRDLLRELIAEFEALPETIDEPDDNQPTVSDAEIVDALAEAMRRIQISHPGRGFHEMARYALAQRRYIVPTAEASRTFADMSTEDEQEAFKSGWQEGWGERARLTTALSEIDQIVRRALG